MYDVVVIGAGQAGLAAGYHLNLSGLRFTLLEAGEQAAGSWSHYYDSLKLFSPAGYSSLPGMRFPGDPHRYPNRDEVIDYLIRYAEAFDLPVRTQTRVQHIERLNDTFRVITNAGDYLTRSVVSATGSFNRPFLPDLPGMQAFKGQILHSREYRNPIPFKSRRVIVVGAGNSAIQIAVELAQSAEVSLATREPIRYLPQRVLGQDLHFWLKYSGVDWRSDSPTGQRTVKVLDTGKYRRTVEAGKPERKPMFREFSKTGVVWQDGSEEEVDAVLFATGYRPNLDLLASLSALNMDGHALHNKGISTTVPGLYYVGLSQQRGLASATLRGVGPDANYVIQHLSRYLQSDPVSHLSLFTAVCCADKAFS